jgi:Lrp/AsnC family transcriptional regulator, leucine-responsive regulatory protein
MGAILGHVEVEVKLFVACRTLNLNLGKPVLDKRYDLNVSFASADSTDHQIIDALTADARRSASQVGRLVGLSPPAAKRRIDRLEQIGLIRGYTAVLDHRMVGDQIEAFIELRFAPGTQVAEVDTAVTDLPEVVESFTLAGDPDALARVRVRDLEHLKTVVDRIRRGRPGGPTILSTRTVIVLSRTANDSRR